MSKQLFWLIGVFCIKTVLLAMRIPHSVLEKPPRFLRNTHSYKSGVLTMRIVYLNNSK